MSAGWADALLADALQAAVPMAIEELRHVGDEERIARARGYAQEIAEHGDVIQFRSPRKGETARAFTALARGLACAAYQPGGVTFAGTHWCTDHAACEAARGGGPQ